MSIATKLSRTIGSISEKLGFDLGTVEESEDFDVVERDDIKSEPTESFAEDSERKVKESKVVIDDDYISVSADKCGSLFGRENREERDASEKLAEQMRNEESIERSRRRLSLFRQEREEYNSEKITEEKTEKVERQMNSTNSQNVNLYVAKPTEYSDEVCKNICSNMRSGKIITVCYEEVKNNDEKLRLYDFVSGCCMALDYNMEKIAKESFVLSPYSARISRMSEAEQTSVNKEEYTF